RYYDPKWSMFIGVDPLADKYPDWSSFAYCANNPIKYVDPDGRDIYRYDEKTGDFYLYEKNNDATDKVGKFEFNKEINDYVLITDSKGNAKTHIDNIAKGILKECRNFREGNEYIEIGGERQPSESQLKDFLVKYSDNLSNCEVSGFAIGYDKSSETINGFVIEEHKGNDLNSCVSARFDKNDPINLYNGFRFKVNKIMHIKYHFHTHPQYGDYVDTPSKDDFKNADNRNMDHFIFYRDKRWNNTTEKRYRKFDNEKTKK
ncbi:RHS repeat-associated core domain-containing protein, partial [Flavobacterium sp. ST-75]